MNVCVIGTGYVGLVTGACLADAGNQVVCLDHDASKVDLLRKGHVPLHEPGLTELIRHNTAAGRLTFTTDAACAIRHGKFLFIAVGTPSGEDGSADLRHVLAVATSIGQHLNDYKVIISKSTVPPGTSELVRQTVGEQLALRGAATDFAVVSNPEFMKEGDAIRDFMHPDRVIIGADDPHAILLMRSLYASLPHTADRLLVMSLRSAELSKYAANAMLAMRISFMNELSLLAEHIGADIEEVRCGIGSDARIGKHFLFAGAGYGGSCFPKDVRALRQCGRAAGITLGLLDAVEHANERQKNVIAAKVTARYGESLDGLCFAVWGLAFKPDTDDIREAPSLKLIPELLQRGARVQAYDPAANDNVRSFLGRHPRLELSTHAASALAGADALIILTEWQEFRCADLEMMRQHLRRAVIFDGRNLYDPKDMRARGFEYHGIGRGHPLAPLAIRQHSTEHRVATQAVLRAASNQS